MIDSFLHVVSKWSQVSKMFFMMFLCSLVAFLVLLDFYVRNFTTYKIAKSLQSPLMLPIIGSQSFLCASQGEIKSPQKKILPQKFSYFWDEKWMLFIAEKTYQITMDLCKQFKNGFAYWTFGFLMYTIYSADSVEVTKFV